VSSQKQDEEPERSRNLRRGQAHILFAFGWAGGVFPDDRFQACSQKTDLLFYLCDSTLPSYPRHMRSAPHSVERRAGWFASVLFLCALVGGGLVLADTAQGEPATPEAVAQEAEAAFRSAMEAWAYDEFWRLWDMGSSASRRALSQGDFTDRMRAGTTRPAAGKQVEAIRVTPQSPDLAMIYVRFGLEDRRRPWAESTDRPFFVRLEDGRWAVNLWDFVGLASYFSPDFIPAQPLFVPPPRPPRPKGPTR
jgi:hypothetical protein